MTDVLNSVEVPDTYIPTDEDEVTLDDSLMIVGNLEGRVLTAARAMKPWAIALSNKFGEKIRAHGISEPIGYPVHLPVEIVEKGANEATGEPKRLERTDCYNWLNENVPLGNDGFRWAVIPNGRDDEVIVKIVKVRNRK